MPGSALSDSSAAHTLDSGRLDGTTVRIAALTSYWLGLSVLWGAITTVVLPRLVEQAVPASVKTSALALIAGLQALASIIVQPAAGAASDRLATPWGRRRPLMVVGVLAQLLFLALLARAGSLWAIALVMVLTEVASNTAQGPYQGLLPDLVPASRRGFASGMIGAAQLAGQVLGVAVAGVLVAAGQDGAAILFAGAAVGLGMATTVLSVHEATSAPMPVHPVGWARHLLHPHGWRQPVQTMLFRVWGSGVLEQRDYVWLLVSRLAILMATGTLQPFIYFYLEDSLRLGSAAAGAVAPLAAVVALVALVSAIPGGALTARWGRVRTVLASALLGAVGAIAFAAAPAYGLLFVIAVPFGMAMGVFLSADWALLVELVPRGEAGRYLGLSNVATAGAGMLAMVIGGPVADLGNAWLPGAGYRIVFVLAGLEFLVGAWCVRHVHEPDAPRSAA